MAILYLMVGLPGSGKTHYAKEFLNHCNYISRDEIRFSMVKENEDYFSKEKQVFKKFYTEIQKSLNSGKDTVADATHINAKSRRKLLDKLNLENTKVVAIYMNTPLGTCINRNKERAGRLKVPNGALFSMYESYSEPQFTEKNKYDYIIWVHGGI